jgi:zinc protease
LKTSNRTLGRFIPTDTVDRTEVPGKPDVMAMVKDYTGRAVVAQGEAFDPSPANVEARTQRFTLPGGLKAALLPKKTKGATVSVVMQLRMGTDESLKAKAQAGQFAASMLMSGTDRLSRQEIKDAFDKLKAQVSVSGNAEGVSASITATRENLPAALDLLAEVMKKSTFPAKEFQEKQLEAINNAEQSIPEPQPLAANAMQRLIDAYPLGHVRHVGTLQEQLAETKAVTADQVKAFHAAFYGANNASFSAVGDFDPVALKTQLSSLFGSWKATQAYVRIPSVMKAAAGAKVTMETPDKANSMLFAIQPLAMKDSAENYPALLIANHMLGGGALRSRLADRIRQKEGLSYGVGSQVSAPALDPAGLWLAYAISAPQNTAKVEAALREEVQKAITEGFTEDELTEAKKGWKQSAEVVRTQDPSLARRLSAYLSIDRTMAYDKDLEAKVAALTVAQVNEALRQSLKVVNLSFITAGDFAKVAKDAAAK